MLKLTFSYFRLGFPLQNRIPTSGEGKTRIPTSERGFPLQNEDSHFRRGENADSHFRREVGRFSLQMREPIPFIRENPRPEGKTLEGFPFRPREDAGFPFWRKLSWRVFHSGGGKNAGFPFRPREDAGFPFSLREIRKRPKIGVSKGCLHIRNRLIGDIML